MTEPEKRRPENQSEEWEVLPPRDDTVVSVYFYDKFNSEGSNANTVEYLEDIAAMYRKGYLPPGSKAWFNSERSRSGMWVLGGESTFLHTAHVPIPGWCRLKKQETRWAPDQVSTTSMPLQRWLLKDAPAIEGADRRTTIVLQHRDAGNRVQFIHSVPRGSGLPQTGGNNYSGRFNYAGFSVVDLPNYVPEYEVAASDSYAQAHAMVHGMEVMAGMRATQEVRLMIQENIERFRVDLNEQAIEALAESRRSLMRWCHAITQQQRKSIYEAKRREVETAKRQKERRDRNSPI